jgi:predicted nuclease of predicted toxin-antitoxin system
MKLLIDMGLSVEWPGPSVIQVRSKDVLPASIGPIVIRALRQHQDLLESGALVVIEPADFRVRVLPI